MGIQTVRLYTNTTSEVPATFTDVTSQFSGLNPNTVADETASGTIQIANQTPGVTTFAWIQALDEAGNTSGIQPVGSVQTKERFYAGFGADNTGITASSRTAQANNTRAINLLDENPATFYQSTVGYPQWVQYELPNPRKLTRYRLRARNDNQLRPSGWRILGSNNGTAFVTVHDVLLPAGTFIPQVISTTAPITVIEEENVNTEGQVWVEPQNVSISSVIDNPDEEFYIGWVYSDIAYRYYRLEITNQPVSGTTSSTVRLSLSHWALSEEEPAQLTLGFTGGVRWQPNTAYTTLANATFMWGRFLLEGVTVGTTGIIAESGSTTTGFALYMHGGVLYVDYGLGSSVNESNVILSHSLAGLPSRFLVEVDLSSAGGKLAINGDVVSSHTRAPTGTSFIGGADPGGMGKSYTTVRANHGGWTGNGAGVFSATIVQGMVYPYNSLVVPNGVFVDNVVTSQRTMTQNFFNTGGGISATPYTGINDLPAFLVGVPMTKGINKDLQASFTEGGIHAYGFRNAGWLNSEPGTTTVYNGLRYDIPNDIDTITQVVYKYFEAANFSIRSASYIWFFTKTPLAAGQAALNAA